MARHKHYSAEEEKDPDLDISSLIDICFLLLIYFLVTSTVRPRETDLGLALPSAALSDKQPDIQPMFIRVDSTGAIYTGVGNSQQVLDTDAASRDVPLLVGQLEFYSNNARASNQTPLVQIQVDNEAQQQRVIDVLNALAGAEINSVTFTDLVND